MSKTKINQDIEMTFDFIRYLIDNPEFINLIPDKSEITFVKKGESQERLSVEKK